MSLNPNVIKPEDYTGGCVPHGPRASHTTAFPSGEDNELRRCPGCNKWWYKDPAYSYVWQPVHWYHFDHMKRIREHEREIKNPMHTLISAKNHVED